MKITYANTEDDSYPFQRYHLDHSTGLKRTVFRTRIFVAVMLFLVVAIFGFQGQWLG